MSRPFPAKRESKCAACGETIQIGMMAMFRDDDKVVHQNCPQQRLTAGVPIESHQPTDGESLFVQIAAWVPVNKLDIVTKAIKEARA
jgi:hypothetical protein